MTKPPELSPDQEKEINALYEKWKKRSTGVRTFLGMAYALGLAAGQQGKGDERVAQLTAHRAIGNQEQDLPNGKLAGYCAVCQTPWPCAYAGTPPPPAPLADDRVIELWAQSAQEPCQPIVESVFSINRVKRFAALIARELKGSPGALAGAGGGENV